MLRSRLIGSITSKGITSILSIDDSNRLLVAKKNGDIEVYSDDNIINKSNNNKSNQNQNQNQNQTQNNNNNNIPNTSLKLSQTYSNLLRNLPNSSNWDLNIEKLLYSEQLSTIFIKCKCLIVLLNSSNLHLYDKIYDKRGIKQTWIKTFANHNLKQHMVIDDDSNSTTLLIYSTAKLNKLRLLIWKGRTYKQMLEITLPKQSNKDSFIKSMEIVANGDSLLFTMISGVYLLNFKTMALNSLSGSNSNMIHTQIASSSSSSTTTSPYLLKIDKVFTRKYPDNAVDAITDLKEFYSNRNGSHDSIDQSKNEDMLSLTSKQTNKSKRSFWGKQSSKSRHTIDMMASSRDVRYIFNPSPNQFMILDGMTENLFSLDLNPTMNKLIANNHKQFFHWNKNFHHVYYISSNLLLIYDDTTIKFIDYKNGFTFLRERIPQGIKKIIKLPGIYYLVWTHDDQLLLYTYQVDDGEDIPYEQSMISISQNTSMTNLYENERQSNATNNNTVNDNDDFSICGMHHDSSFYQLWRKVLFYKFFLESQFSIELCASDDPQESLDICAMKLRDLTVMWCLQIFATLQDIMNKLHYPINTNDNDLPIKYLERIEEVIIKDIFNLFIIMWAPPQLIIVKTFPLSISYLVELISQQEHKCHDDISSNREQIYSINSNLIKKWVIPYLTDTRRHLRNLLLKGQHIDENNNGTITWNYGNRHIPQDLDFFLLDRHGSIKIETMLTLLETVLFKTYIIYIPSMVGPLIRVENLCDTKIVIKDLKNNKMYKELVDFYHQKDLHKEALEFLFDYISIHSNDKDMDNEDRSEANQMDKCKLIIGYLKKLPNNNLDDLFLYLTKLIDIIKNPEETNDIILSIFKSNNPTNLKRDYLKIYQFIDKIDESLSLQYLEFITSTIRNIDTRMYTYLVTRYISNLTTENKQKLEVLLKSSDAQYNSKIILNIIEDYLNDDEYIKGKNDKERVFIDLLQIYPLFNLQRHERSIDILFNKINDYKLASDYCNKVYYTDNNEDVGSNIHLYLLQKIIHKINNDDRKDSNDPYTEQLIIFLHDHKDKIDPVETLKLLPKEFPLKDIKQYLAYAIRDRITKEQDLLLKKNVLQVELTNLKYSINHKSTPFVEVNSNLTCRVCNKSFHSLNSESVYWFTMANGKNYVVHYNCGRSLQNRLHINKNRVEDGTHPMDLQQLKKFMFGDNSN